MKSNYYPRREEKDRILEFCSEVFGRKERFAQQLLEFNFNSVGGTDLCWEKEPVWKCYYFYYDVIHNRDDSN